MKGSRKCRKIKEMKRMKVRWMENSERESLNVRMRHGDDDETNKAQTRATVLSIMYARNCATDEDSTNNKEKTLQTNKLRALTSLQLLFS